jgi:hypothetical protein
MQNRATCHRLWAGCTLGERQKAPRRGEAVPLESAPPWWDVAGGLSMQPATLERILRTYLLGAKIPQSKAKVANITTILTIMLEPHPFGQVEPEDTSGSAASG